MATHEATGSRLRRELQPGADLVEVLVCTTAAARMLIGQLQRDRALPAVRLTCRGLRSYVDEQVDVLNMVWPRKKSRWAAGQVPSLERWPFCSTVCIDLDMVKAPDTDLNATVTLPFKDLTLGARSRIKSLSLRRQAEIPITPPLWYSEPLVAPLLALLPGLQSVQLDSLQHMMYDHDHQENMYKSLASLPHLVSLSLPSFRALRGIGALAGTLQHLTVLPGGVSWDSPTVSIGASKGLRMLQRLRSLTLGPRFFSEHMNETASTRNESLRTLLDDLPLSLETLDITNRHKGAPSDHLALRLNVRNGHVTAIRTFTGGQQADKTGLGAVTAVAVALTDLRRLGPNLELVAMEALCVCDPKALSEWALAPLKKLLARCSRFEVACLHAASSECAAVAVTRLGRPRQVVLQPAGCSGSAPLVLRLCADPDGQHGAPRLGRDAGPVSVPSLSRPNLPRPLGPAALSSQFSRTQQPAPLGTLGTALSFQGLVSALLRRLTGGAAAVAATAAAGVGAAPLASTAAPPLRPSAPAAAMLLLQGPFVVSLVKDHRAMRAWMRAVEQHAAKQAAVRARHMAVTSALALGDPSRRGLRPAGATDAWSWMDTAAGERCAGSGGCTVRRQLLLSYQALPAAGAVVLSCSAPEAAACVASAVMRLAAMPDGGACSSGGGQAEGALRVVPVSAAVATAAASMWNGAGGVRQKSLARDTVLQALAQVLQAVWDGASGALRGDRATEASLLRRLLDGWEQVVGKELPSGKSL